VRKSEKLQENYNNPGKLTTYYKLSEKQVTK